MARSRVALVIATAVLPVLATTHVGARPPESQAVPVLLSPATASSVLVSPASGGGVPRMRLRGDAFAMLDLDRMLATLEELTGIGRDGLFRTSASRGEAEAFDRVAAWLSELRYLAAIGLEVERQAFHTFLGGDVWEARLFLTVGGQEIEVPAHALQGHRESLPRVLRFDSDGGLNDSQRDPVEVSGLPVVVRTYGQLASLTSSQVSGRVVLVDYAVVDRSLMGTTEATSRATHLLAQQPAAVVMITSFSNVNGVSHGSFVGDLPGIGYVTEAPPAPTLYARVEDLGGAGITTVSDLSLVQSARLRWDQDVYSPGNSQSLIARIPGLDPSRAMILGAHLDSPNSPGALDDGSGSVALLEVVRVLDRARVRPPVDLYLCWFGSHERGLYGSSTFLPSHSEVLDRAIAMQQMDCLGRPLVGLSPSPQLSTWPYGRWGDESLPWPSYLRQAASQHGAWPNPLLQYGSSSDNTFFLTFDVPNANLIHKDPNNSTEIHYAGHWHDPYDTVELVREVGQIYLEMARVMLTAALDAGRDDPSVRVTPTPTRRALFVASHTETPHMSGAALVDLGMLMAWEGFDLDVVPYGTPVTAEHLEDADLVVVLPVHDFPSPEGDLSLYDEEWQESEIGVLEDYVQDGGFLILTNSAHRLLSWNRVYEANEDWNASNPLAERFGVTWQSGTIDYSIATRSTFHPLMVGASLTLVVGNGLQFSMSAGQVLARAGGRPAAALVTHGNGGEVLVLSDVGCFNTDDENVPNLQFWNNMLDYARNR